MARRNSLGELEQLTLMAIMRLRPLAYGMTVRSEVQTRTGRQLSLGAIYATLDRLNRKGMTRSAEGPAVPERGGRARRFFEITDEGLAALQEAITASDRMREGLEGLKRPEGVTI